MTCRNAIPEEEQRSFLSSVHTGTVVQCLPLRTLTWNSLTFSSLKKKIALLWDVRKLLEELEGRNDNNQTCSAIENLCKHAIFSGPKDTPIQRREWRCFFGRVVLTRGSKAFETMLCQFRADYCFHVCSEAENGCHKVLRLLGSC